MNIEETQRILDSYSTLIGIDWADSEHAVFVMNTQTREGTHNQVQNEPALIVEWLGKQKKQAQDQKVLVIMEQNDTNLKHTLAVYDWVDVVEVTASKLKSFRETFSTSGAKNDPGDAAALVQLYLHHPGEFPINDPDDELTRSLDHHARKRRKLVDKRGDLANMMRSELKKYFPQAIELTGCKMHSKMACKFLKRWPTLAALTQEDPEQIRAFYKRHRLRSSTIEQRLQIIEEAVPVTDDDAVIDPLKRTVQALAGSIKEMTDAISKFDGILQEQFAKHEDQHIWTSFPSAGDQMAPRLLAAFGDDRSNWENAEEMQVFGGIAPVTEDSGNSRWVHWRWSAPAFLRQTFYEYAELSVQESLWAKAFYDMKKQQGDDHQTATRKLAYKWIRIMYRCWKEKIPYNERTYLKALLRSDSKVPNYIDEDLSPLEEEVA